MRNETSVQPNTRGLLAHAQRKAAETQQRVHQAIDRLLREQEVVNFNTVAKVAHVTKSYLYAHADVRERIEALRATLGQGHIERQWARTPAEPGSHRQNERGVASRQGSANQGPGRGKSPAQSTTQGSIW